MEIWKPIPGYEEIYSVSNFGRIRRDRKRKDRWKNVIFIKLINRSNGYKCFNLFKDSKRKMVDIHILVARAFLGPCPEGMEINHKDLEKTNNHIDNLEYITHLENVRHSFKNSTRKIIKGADHKNSKLTEKEVIDMRADRINGKKFRELAEKYNVDISTAQSIIARKKWKHI